MLKHFVFLLGFGLLFSCSKSSEVEKKPSLASIFELGELTVKGEVVNYNLTGEAWETYQEVVNESIDEFAGIVNEQIGFVYAEMDEKSLEKHCYQVAYKYQNSSPCEFTIEYGPGYSVNFQRSCSSSGWYTPFFGIWNCTNICRNYPSSQQCVQGGGTAACSDFYTGFKNGAVISVSGGYPPGSSCSANVQML